MNGSVAELFANVRRSTLIIGVFSSAHYFDGLEIVPGLNNFNGHLQVSRRHGVPDDHSWSASFSGIERDGLSWLCIMFDCPTAGEAIDMVEKWVANWIAERGE